MPTANAVAAQATGSAPSPSVTPGAVTTSASASTATAAAQSPTVSPGAVQVSSSGPATATASTLAAEVNHSFVPAVLANATATAPSPTVTPGPVQTVAGLDTASANTSAPTVSPGPVQTAATASQATADTAAAAVVPGEVWIPAVVAQASIVAPAATIVQGPPLPLIVIRIVDVFVVSSDTIRIEFTGDMAVDKNLMSVGSYQITPTAVIQEVVRPVDRKTTAVLLSVRGLIPGREYTLSVVADVLRDARGIATDDLVFTWIHRKTKVDLAISSLPGCFTTRVRSTFRGVIEAMMISDEEIGGDF